MEYLTEYGIETSMDVILVLKIASWIAAVIIPAIALFGDTHDEKIKGLNKKGKAIIYLSVMYLVGVICIEYMSYEKERSDGLEEEAKRSELVKENKVLLNEIIESRKEIIKSRSDIREISIGFTMVFCPSTKEVKEYCDYLKSKNTNGGELIDYGSSKFPTSNKFVNIHKLLKETDLSLFLYARDRKEPASMTNFDMRIHLDFDSNRFSRRDKTDLQQVWFTYDWRTNKLFLSAINVRATEISRKTTMSSMPELIGSTVVMSGWNVYFPIEMYIIEMSIKTNGQSLGIIPRNSCVTNKGYAFFKIPDDAQWEFINNISYSYDNDPYYK